MAAPNSLSETDLTGARAELSVGKPVTVWFTPAAVGVPERASAKVVSIDEVPEGEFIQVRLAGSRDTMFCSPSELTRSRPARVRREQAVKPAEAQVPKAQLPRPPVPKPPVTEAPVVEPEVPAPRPSVVAPPEPVRSVAPPEPVARRPRAAAARPPARPAEVTVTLSSTSEGEWSVEVVIGKKRTVRPTPVQPAEVAKAARALPEAVGEAIESSLEAARVRQAERVERLSAELEAAQRALQELSG